MTKREVLVMAITEACWNDIRPTKEKLKHALNCLIIDDFISLDSEQITVVLQQLSKQNGNLEIRQGIVRDILNLNKKLSNKDFSYINKILPKVSRAS